MLGLTLVLSWCRWGWRPAFPEPAPWSARLASQPQAQPQSWSLSLALQEGDETSYVTAGATDRTQLNPDARPKGPQPGRCPRHGSQDWQREKISSTLESTHLPADGKKQNVIFNSKLELESMILFKTTGIMTLFESLFIPPKTKHFDI